MAERCGTRIAQRVEERVNVPFWATRGQSRRNGLRRFHSRLSGATGRYILCGVHRDALSLANLAGVRAPLRPPLSPHDENQRCGVAIERSEEHTSELQSRLHLVCRLLL